MKTLLTLALCCATIAPAAHAQSADDSGFHSHYPQHYFFQYMSPPAPSAEGPFGFDSGANRGYEDENYERSHGLKSSSAECEFSSCPCPSEYFRNSTNCAPVWPTRPPDEQSEED